MEEVLGSVHGYIGHVEATTVSEGEGCGLLRCPLNKELDSLRLVFVTPVEWLAILRLQDQQEVRLVHIDVGLAKEDVLRGQVNDDVLGRDLDHSSENAFFLSYDTEKTILG